MMELFKLKLDMLILKFIWNNKHGRMLITILKEKLSDIKTYDKVSVIKTLLCWHMRRQIDRGIEKKAQTLTQVCR